MEISPRDLYNLSPFEVRRILFDLAEEGFQACLARKEPARILNAGRGNPNFLNIPAREAFNLLSGFALQQAASSPERALGFRPEQKNLHSRLRDYLRERPGRDATFLSKALEYAETTLNLDRENLIFEWVDGLLGDYYPVPPRIYGNTERILLAYLSDILKLPPGPFHLFATEGATAAIIYLFKSLKINHLLRPGNQIAVATPIYSPYLEIPQLEEYGLEILPIRCKKELNWQIPDDEIEKLSNPAVKIFFLVNPGNPTAAGLDEPTVRKIADLIKTKRSDLLVLTDAVYATFSGEYHGLVQEVPENTILIYSFSKYFGATGWRLGAVLMTENHVADRLLANLPLGGQAGLNERYGLVSNRPEKIPFLERMALDSRDIALAHTGGLSGPQQVMMGLMSLCHLLDEKGDYLKTLKDLLSRRAGLFYGGLGLTPPEGNNLTHYYALVDLLEMARERYGETFVYHLSWNHTVFDFLCRLAKEKLTIALPGEGFGGDPWTIRVSLANLDEDACAAAGKNIWEILGLFHAEWQIDRK